MFSDGVGAGPVPARWPDRATSAVSQPFYIRRCFIRGKCPLRGIGLARGLPLQTPDVSLQFSGYNIMNTLLKKNVFIKQFLNN